MSETDECHCCDDEAHIAMLRERMETSDPSIGEMEITDETMLSTAEQYSGVLGGRPTLLDNVIDLVDLDRLDEVERLGLVVAIREQVDEILEFDDETLLLLADHVHPLNDVTMFRRWLNQQQPN